MQALVLDTINQCLWRGGQRVTLTIKCFDLLRCLVERRPNLVTKRQILDAVWVNTRVEEGQVKQFVAELRRVLGDDAGNPALIENVRGRGYRFAGRIELMQQAVDHPPAAAHGRAAATDGKPAVFGYDQPMQRLHHCLARVREGSVGLAMIEGRRGMGKTTLVETFIQQVGVSSEVIVLSALCRQAADLDQPLMPLLDAVERHLVRERDAPALALLHRHAPAWSAMLRRRMEGDAQADQGVDGGWAQTLALGRELGRWLEALAAQRPVILWLDDVHHADADTLGLLRYVMSQPRPGPLFLVLTSTPLEHVGSARVKRDLACVLAEARALTEIALSGLDVPAVEDWLAALWPAHHAHAARWLQEISAGSPATLSRMLAAVTTDDLETLSDAQWPASRNAGLLPDATRIRLPLSLLRLGDRLLGALTEEDRCLLQALSLAGEVIDRQALARLPAEQGRHCVSRLDRLAQEGRFLGRADDPVTGEVRYRFVCPFRWWILRMTAASKQPDSRGARDDADARPGTALPSPDKAE